MLEMINTTNGALTAGQPIPFTSVTFSTNDNVVGTPAAGTADISEPGIYEITGTFVLEATAEGNVTVNLMADGTAEPGATAQFSAAAANTIETVQIDKVIQIDSAPAGNTAQLLFELVTGSAATTLINGVMNVKKIN